MFDGLEDRLLGEICRTWGLPCTFQSWSSGMLAPLINKDNKINEHAIVPSWRPEDQQLIWMRKASCCFSIPPACCFSTPLVCCFSDIGSSSIAQACDAWPGFGKEKCVGSDYWCTCPCWMSSEEQTRACFNRLKWCFWVFICSFLKGFCMRA